MEKNVDCHTYLTVKIQFCRESWEVHVLILSPYELMGAYIEHMVALNAYFICSIYSSFL